jgi:hypothetical protein
MNNNNLCRVSVWIDSFGVFPHLTKNISDPESFVAKNKLEPWIPPLECPDAFVAIDTATKWYKKTVFADKRNQEMIIGISKYTDAQMDSFIVDELFPEE